MLIAAATFTVAGPLTRRIRREGPETFHYWAVPLQFVIATYGGYFGGGMGIMMLATFSIAGMTDIHRMNGLKAVLGVAINAVALAAFIWNGIVVWQAGLATAAGGVIGGYTGAWFARRLERNLVRWVVIVIGWAMTVYFFVR
jgi:uncharacterized membrane protein YfcA